MMLARDLGKWLADYDREIGELCERRNEIQQEIDRRNQVYLAAKRVLSEMLASEESEE